MKFSVYLGFREMYRGSGNGAPHRAARMGFDGIEMYDNCHYATIPDGDAADALRDAAEKEGLSFTCYSAGIRNLYADVDGVAALRRHANIAAHLGAPYFHHTLISTLSPADDAPTYREVFHRVVERALKVADTVNQLGLTCLYEPQGYYFNGLEGYGEFYEEMKRHGVDVGVCYDCGNTLFAGVRPLDFLKVFGKDVRNVHAKDFKRVSSEGNTAAVVHKLSAGHYLTDVPFGKGDCELAAAAEELKRLSYDGAVAYEAEKHDLVKGAKEDLPFLKSLFQEEA